MGVKEELGVEEQLGAKKPSWFEVEIRRIMACKRLGYHDAADLLQEAARKILQAPPAEGVSLEAALQVSLGSAHVDLLRRRRRRREVQLSEKLAMGVRERPSGRTAAAELAWKLVDELPEGARADVEAHFLGRETLTSIAQRSGRHRLAVAKKMKGALRRLAKVAEGIDAPF